MLSLIYYLLAYILDVNLLFVSIYMYIMNFAIDISGKVYKYVTQRQLLWRPCGGNYLNHIIP